MQAPRQCPKCGIELGVYVETHCPQCGTSLTPKALVTPGIWLLDLIAGICGTLFVLGLLFGGVFYVNSSSRAQLYKGAPYHPTTFRVTYVQYMWVAGYRNAGHIQATATGIVEGQKESMNLMPFLGRAPRDQGDLTMMVPEGTLLNVYLFPSLQGRSRIQPINQVPPEESYRGQAVWAAGRALPVVGAIGILGVLLGLGRSFLLRNRKVAN
jgi:hypothetical protein